MEVERRTQGELIDRGSINGLMVLEMNQQHTQGLNLVSNVTVWKKNATYCQIWQPQQEHHNQWLELRIVFTDTGGGSGGNGGGSGRHFVLTSGWTLGLLKAQTSC